MGSMSIASGWPEQVTENFWSVGWIPFTDSHMHAQVKVSQSSHALLTGSSCKNTKWRSGNYMRKISFLVNKNLSKN